MTRGDCPTSRPCCRLTCRAHLLLNVSATGALKLNGVRGSALPLIAPAELVDAFELAAIERLFSMPETCALDVADRGQRLGPRRLARLLGRTKQSVQSELRPVEATFRAALTAAGVVP